MTPSRLRTFLTVVETGSARAAAARLTVTESAVSASLALLQREVGVPLFSREGRGLRLTESGTALTGYARRILGLIDEGLAAARQGVAPEHGRVRIGAVTTAGEYLVPGLLASFRRRYPEVEITLEVGVRDRVLSALADNQLDLTIAGRPLAGQITWATRANSLIVVAAAGHDPAGDPASATWLLREPGSGTRATTSALLNARQWRPRTLTLGSHGAVVASAVVGLGIALVSADAVAHQLAGDELRRVPVTGTPLARPWHVVTSTTPTASTRLFLRHVTDRGAAGSLAFTRRRGQPAPG